MAIQNEDWKKLKVEEEQELKQLKYQEEILKRLEEKIGSVNNNYYETWQKFEKSIGSITDQSAQSFKNSLELLTNLLQNISIIKKQIQLENK